VLADAELWPERSPAATGSGRKRLPDRTAGRSDASLAPGVPNGYHRLQRDVLRRDVVEHPRGGAEAQVATDPTSASAAVRSSR
jgi:hypothetical protein